MQQWQDSKSVFSVLHTKPLMTTVLNEHCFIMLLLHGLHPHYSWSTGIVCWWTDAMLPFIHFPITPVTSTCLSRKSSQTNKRGSGNLLIKQQYFCPSGVPGTSWQPCTWTGMDTMPASLSRPSALSSSRMRLCPPTTCTALLDSVISAPVTYLRSVNNKYWYYIMKDFLMLILYILYVQQCNARRRRREVQTTEATDPTTLSSTIPIVTQNDQGMLYTERLHQFKPVVVQCFSQSAWLKLYQEEILHLKWAQSSSPKDDVALP